jgi:hypothetical protein
MIVHAPIMPYTEDGEMKSGVTFLPPPFSTFDPEVRTHTRLVFCPYFVIWHSSCTDAHGDKASETVIDH